MRTAHWAAKSHLAGLKDDTVVIAVRVLESTEFHEEFYEMSTPLTDPDAAPERLSKRLYYPSVDHLLFPEKGQKASTAAAVAPGAQWRLVGAGARWPVAIAAAVGGDCPKRRRLASFYE